MVPVLQMDFSFLEPKSCVGRGEWIGKKGTLLHVQIACRDFRFLCC